MTDLALTKAIPTPNELISQAIAQGMSGEQLNGLLQFAINYKAEAAKEAYFQAFNKFKEAAPKIIKDSEIRHNGKLIGMYAKLEQACQKLIPALGSVKITHRWDSTTVGDYTTVTCYLRHEMGYEEKGASLGSGPDTSGAKNAVQAIGSTMSYLQRYTLMASCGLTVEGMDTDGNLDTPQMAEPVLLEWLDGMRQAPHLDALKDVYRKAYTAAKTVGDLDAQKSIVDVYEKQKRELAKDERN
jgi:hypothetical protein